MQELDVRLFKDIAALEIGSENDVLTFTDRLCRENNWSKPFAKRCVEEYKKFIYLATMSDTPVTPSDEIDQVWHLHLTYTQSYWIDLCQTILDKPLHHGPTKGGVSESTKYQSQYQLTLDKYVDVFKESPPPDVWPNCQTRFHNADRFVRLNSADYFLLKRKPLFSFGFIVALPLFLAACVKSDTNALEIASILLLSLTCFYLLNKLLFSNKSKKKGGAGCAGCRGKGSDGEGGSGCGGCGGCGG